LFFYNDDWSTEQEIKTALTTSQTEDFDMQDRYKFRDIAKEIYSEIFAFVSKEYTISITGHSLNSILSVVLAMHLHQDGFKVSAVITFGQPKFLSQKGAEKVTLLPVLRVVDPRDIVPQIFPGFLHSGPELLLLAGQHYAHSIEIPAHKDLSPSLLEPAALKLQLGYHATENYVKRLTEKYSDALCVPLSDMEKYM